MTQPIYEYCIRVLEDVSSVILKVHIFVFGLGVTLIKHRMIAVLNKINSDMALIKTNGRVITVNSGGLALRWRVTEKGISIGLQLNTDNGEQSESELKICEYTKNLILH